LPENPEGQLKDGGRKGEKKGWERTWGASSGVSDRGLVKGCTGSYLLLIKYSPSDTKHD